MEEDEKLRTSSVHAQHEDKPKHKEHCQQQARKEHGKLQARRTYEEDWLRKSAAWILVQDGSQPR